MADNAANNIQDLIKTLRDGEKGYKEAAEHAKASDLKSRFLQISSERGRFAEQLQPEASKAGAEIKKDEGHVAGAIHRAWIDIKESLGGGDQAILDWLEQGEDVAKAKFEAALKSDLPPTALTIVREQFQSIVRDHDAMKAMRDTYKAA